MNLNKNHRRPRRAPGELPAAGQRHPKITDDHPDMDWDDAYAIQAEILARKQARGLRWRASRPA
jgi:2-keto-4-pentenoate hydratase